VILNGVMGLSKGVGGLHSCLVQIDGFNIRSLSKHWRVHLRQLFHYGLYLQCVAIESSKSRD